jgi:hypothetical protein
MMESTESDNKDSHLLQAPIFNDYSGQHSLRPKFSSNRPSWIGPQLQLRPTTPDIPAMAQKHQIHYSHPGLQPPVFIAGSMCEPRWEPIEMVHKEKEGGELHFVHEFTAEPGQYQYKFRLGPGDWWVLDESKPTGRQKAHVEFDRRNANECALVDDGTGIRNNLLTVEEMPEPKKDDAAHAQTLQNSQEEKVPAASQPTDAHTKQASSVLDVEDDDDDDDDDGIPESEKNLFRHETIQVADNSGESDIDEIDQVEHENEDDEDEEPPLLDHEAGPFERVDSQYITPLQTDDYVFDDPAEVGNERNEDVEDDEVGAPLFRHETGGQSDLDPDEAPLFRHESLSPMDVMPLSPMSRKNRKLNSEDVNDPSLEPFPTDEAGIQARIQRAATRLREDDVVFEGTPPSPSLIQTKSFSPQAPPAALPHGETSDLSHLDAIAESEEADDADNTTLTEDTMQFVPVDFKVQDVAELDSSPSFTLPPDVPNRDPPTPPMTPTKDNKTKTAHHDGSADLQDSPNVKDSRSSQKNMTDHIASRPSPSETTKAAQSTGKGEPKDSLASNLWVWFAGLCGGQGRAT